jgi:YD repeat-containing protein
MERRRFRRTLNALLLIAALSVCAYAQGSATRYVYDDNGRLRAVIAPNGEANVYEYDAAGNITAIRRNTATTLEALDFYPREGVPGTQVTIVGTGFGAGVNSVLFNGAPAQIVSTNAPQIIVTVPSGATTGPISVTTASGTVTTALPFTVKGIGVTPPSATLLSDRTLQFAATVVVAGAPDVVWSVAGIEGGTPAVGTIDATGLYTAPRLVPSLPIAVFRVRATSVSDPSVYGEAVVTVRNPEFIQPVYGRDVLVRNGVPPNATPIYGLTVSVRNGSPANNNSAVYGPTLSVRNGSPANNTPIHGLAVSVQNGGPANNNSAVYGPVLSVRNGNPANPTPIRGLAVTVQNGNPSNATPIYGPTVSVTAGPSVQAITPAQAQRGAAVNITINGLNLTGTTAVSVINVANNAIDTNTTASNISVNGAGTSLTATLTINGAASLGRRIVFVTTSGLTSQLTDTGANTIEVIP